MSNAATCTINVNTSKSAPASRDGEEKTPKLRCQDQTWLGFLTIILTKRFGTASVLYRTPRCGSARTRNRYQTLRSIRYNLLNTWVPDTPLRLGSVRPSTIPPGTARTYRTHRQIYTQTPSMPQSFVNLSTENRRHKHKTFSVYRYTIAVRVVK